MQHIHTYMRGNFSPMQKVTSISDGTPTIAHERHLHTTCNIERPLITRDHNKRATSLHFAAASDRRPQPLYTSFKSARNCTVSRPPPYVFLPIFASRLLDGCAKPVTQSTSPPPQLCGKVFQVCNTHVDTCPGNLHQPFPTSSTYIRHAT